MNRVSSGRRTMEVLADDPRSNPGSNSDVLLLPQVLSRLYIYISTKWYDKIRRYRKYRIIEWIVLRVRAWCMQYKIIEKMLVAVGHQDNISSFLKQRLI